jgi:hypothetical protein
MRLKKIERESLAYFAEDNPKMSRPRPEGLGGVGLTNFIGRKWIERFGRDGTTGEQLYRITAEGLSAYRSSAK